MSPDKQSRTSQVSPSCPQPEALEKFYAAFRLRETSPLCSSFISWVQERNLLVQCK